MRVFLLVWSVMAAWGAEPTFMAFQPGPHYFPSSGRIPLEIAVGQGGWPPVAQPCRGTVSLVVNGEAQRSFPVVAEQINPISIEARGTGWHEILATFHDESGRCAPVRAFDVVYIGTISAPFFKVWPVGGKYRPGEFGLVAGIVPPNRPALPAEPDARYLTMLLGIVPGTSWDLMPGFPFYSYQLPHGAVADTVVQGRVNLSVGSPAYPIFPLAEFEIELLRDGRCWLTTVTGRTSVANSDGIELWTAFDGGISARQVDGATLTIYDGNVVLGTMPAPLRGTGFRLPALAAGRHLLRAEVRNSRTGMTAASNVFALDVTPASQMTLSVGGAPLLAAITETDRISLETRVNVNGAAATGGEVEFAVRNAAGVNVFGGKAAVRNGVASIVAGNFAVGAYQATARYTASGGASSAEANATFRVEPGLTVRHAASGGVVLAPNGIASLYGRGLSEVVGSASGVVTSLGGVSIEVEDANRRRTLAPLFFVSPTQVNFLIPAGVALGPAQLEVKLEGRSPLRTNVSIAASAPGIFTVDGVKIPSGLVTLVDGEGRVTNQFTFRCLLGEPCRGEPVVLRENTREAVLTLYGTGFRAEAATTVALAQGQYLDVLFAGAQPEFPGLDQINLRLPLWLRQRGTVGLELRTRDSAAQRIELEFR